MGQRKSFAHVRASSDSAETMEKEGVVSQANHVGKREVLVGDHSSAASNDSCATSQRQHPKWQRSQPPPLYVPAISAPVSPPPAPGVVFPGATATWLALAFDTTPRCAKEAPRSDAKLPGVPPTLVPDTAFCTSVFWHPHAIGRYSHEQTCCEEEAGCHRVARTAAGCTWRLATTATPDDDS